MENPLQWITAHPEHDAVYVEDPACRSFGRETLRGLCNLMLENLPTGAWWPTCCHANSQAVHESLLGPPMRVRVHRTLHLWQSVPALTASGLARCIILSQCVPRYHQVLTDKPSCHGCVVLHDMCMRLSIQRWIACRQCYAIFQVPWSVKKALNVGVPSRGSVSGESDGCTYLYSLIQDYGCLQDTCLTAINARQCSASWRGLRRERPDLHKF